VITVQVDSVLDTVTGMITLKVIVFGVDAAVTQFIRTVSNGCLDLIYQQKDSLLGM